MAQAMSPREPPPRLRSTSAENGEKPRKKQSVFQEVSLARGYTVRAGFGRRRRLQQNKGKVVFYNEPYAESESESGLEREGEGEHRSDSGEDGGSSQAP